nr:MAG TPA: nuclear pore complex protein [Caudoviricetes sp.]
MASKKLKVSVDADASGFKKEMAAAKKSTEEFSKAADEMSDSLEDALGVPISSVTKIGDKLKAAGVLMKSFATDGEKSFQTVALGAKMVSTAVAGIGLAGLLAAFKSINAEAERFRGTMQGAAVAAQDEAWKNTYKQYVSDQVGIGEKAVDSINGWSKFWTKLGAAWTLALKNGFAGEQYYGQMAEEASRISEGADDAAKKAAAYAKVIFDTIEGIKDKQIEWKNSLSEVAALMLTASDKSKTVQERQEAVAKAIALQKQVSGDQIAMQKTLADNIKAQNDLANSSVEDMDRQRSAYAAVEDLSRDLNQRLREMTSLQNEIANSAAATEQKWRDGVNKAIDIGMTELAKFNAEMEKAMEMRDKMATDNIFAPLSAMPGNLTGKADTGKGLIGGTNIDEEALKGLQQLTQFDTSAVDGLLSKIDPSKLSDSFEGYYNFLDEMIKATDDANKALNDAIVGGISDSFQYLANCVAGLDELSGAGMMNALLSPLAAAAIKMGEIMVSAGLASEAFKSMLTNPYTAIAAGAALIAVGAAAKAGLQAAVNSATGTSYVASSVASSGYSNNSSNDRSWEREMTLHVTGTLQADGSKLVAVLNNEANRKRYTT